ncbi:MAG: DNA-binding domain-containing protein [Pseudomonadota bacterium]
MGLTEQQHSLQAYVLNPHSARGAEGYVVSTAAASAARRLQIYSEAYRLRLEEALRTDFEALHGLLGDAQFNELCLRYIDAHPSRHFSLRYFGQHMSGFLRHTEPYAGQPVLSELAAFEWALIDAFDAPDGAVTGVADIAALPAQAWPAMRFVLHDSVRRLDLAWNAPSIRDALKEERVPDAPRKSETPQPWLIWRQELNTYFRALSAPEGWALDAARAGHDFAAVCAGLCQWMAEEQAAASAAGFLRRWAGDGLIKEVMRTEG